MQVSWNPGTVDTINNTEVARVLRSVELPMPSPRARRGDLRGDLPLQLPQRFAVGDQPRRRRRPQGLREIWSSLKNRHRQARVAEFLE